MQKEEKAAWPSSVPAAIVAHGLPSAHRGIDDRA